MTSDACREFRGALGAAALGDPDAAEQLALQAHLDGCPECRAELRELSSVARALPLVDHTRLEVRAEPASVLGEQVLNRVARERALVKHRRRRRVALAAVATVAAAAVIALAILVVPGSPSHETEVAFPTQQGVDAHATLRAREAGTEVAFRVSGLKSGAYYWLWVTGEDGDRVGAGTFRGTESPAKLLMTAAVPLDEARRIWVTDAHDRVVLDATLPR